MPDAEDRIGKLLDVDYEIPDDQRVDELVSLLRSGLRRLIERGATVTRLRAMADDGSLAGAGIRGPARDALTGAA